MGEPVDPAAEVVHRITQCGVLGFPDALHRGEASHQHRISIFRTVERLFGRRLTRRRGPAILAEMADEMDMGVDQSRQQSQPREIICGGLAAAISKLGDLRAVDCDHGVALYAASAVDQRASADGERLPRRRNR
jgi:hypothetical protein